MLRAISGKIATTPVYHLKKEDGKMAETPCDIVETLIFIITENESYLFEIK